MNGVESSSHPCPSSAISFSPSYCVCWSASVRLDGPYHLPRPAPSTFVAAGEVVQLPPLLSIVGEALGRPPLRSQVDYWPWPSAVASSCQRKSGSGSGFFTTSRRGSLTLSSCNSLLRFWILATRAALFPPPPAESSTLTCRPSRTEWCNFRPC